MNRLLLILFSACLAWPQAPAGTRCDLGPDRAVNACACCADGGGACGCVSPCETDSQNLPLTATRPAASHTELLFAPGVAGGPALPLPEPANLFSYSPSPAPQAAVPLFRRDCALRL